jgi:hypothetical protein
MIVRTFMHTQDHLIDKECCHARIVERGTGENGTRVDGGNNNLHAHDSYGHCFCSPLVCSVSFVGDSSVIDHVFNDVCFVRFAFDMAAEHTRQIRMENTNVHRKPHPNLEQCRDRVDDVHLSNPSGAHDNGVAGTCNINSHL